MKIVELVFLLGAQCVSPLESHPQHTEVSKVPCAVVIEKDTEAQTVTVSPEWAARLPRVAEAMKLPVTAVPASAPPPVQMPPRPPLAAADVAKAPAPDAPPAAEPAPPEAQVAALPPDEQKPDPKPEAPAKKTVTAAAKEPTNLCGANRKAVWYTASPGHRKYRCRPAGEASAATPAPQKKAAKKKAKSLY